MTNKLQFLPVPVKRGIKEYIPVFIKTLPIEPDLDYFRMDAF